MGADEPSSTDLSGDGVERLRDFFRARFSGDAVIGNAVDGVLRDIADEWANAGAMPTDDYERLVEALSPHIRRLASVPVSDAKASAEALVRAWRAVRHDVKWC